MPPRSDRWSVGSALAALAICATAFPAGAAAADLPAWTAITSGAHAFTSPVVTTGGTILALSHGRAGAEVVACPFVAEEPSACRALGSAEARTRPADGGRVVGIALGSTAEAPVVIREGRLVADPGEPDAVVRLAPGSDAEDELFRARAGERLSDAAISPDRRWIALIARRDATRRDAVPTTRVLVVDALDGSAREIQMGEGDRWGTSFAEGGSAVWFVGGEGEYSLLGRVPVPARAGSSFATPELLRRDRATWGRAVPLGSDSRRVVVARDTGEGPRLWLVELGSPGMEPLTPAGRAARDPALTADGREIVFVGAARGGANLFRIPVPGAPRPDAPITIGTAPP